ncbi:hypothetical protein TURU_010600 [Turdus rufiventris]|nr:hypothetical protein TURU_010600 [Turdus rufiventris]
MAPVKSSWKLLPYPAEPIPDGFEDRHAAGQNWANERGWSSGDVEKSNFPLESSGERGYLSVPKPLCYLVWTARPHESELSPEVFSTGDASRTEGSKSKLQPMWKNWTYDQGSAVADIGETTQSYLSNNPVLIKNPEGQTATIQPYITVEDNKPSAQEPPVLPWRSEA